MSSKVKNTEHAWKKEYQPIDGAWYRAINKENKDDSTGRYEIVFDFENNRYYCFVDAGNIDEALGIFFVNHETVTFAHVIDSDEV